MLSMFKIWPFKSIRHSRASIPNKMLSSAVLALIAALALLPIAQAQNTPLRVGFQSGEINVILTYAINSNIFQKHNLDVTLTPFPAGPQMLPALAANEIDVAWMGEVPAVTGFSNGMPIEIFMMERLDFTNVRLVANPASGITDLAGLRGKRVGASVGSTSHNHLLLALTQGGLTQRDITLVNLSPANMPPAYEAGQIDAAFTWEPSIGIIEASGGQVIATTRSLGTLTGGIWVAQQSLATTSPQALQLFARAWREAQADYINDPSRVRQFEANRINQTAEEFDALVARQTASHPSFEALLTSEFMGPPDEELDSRLMKHFQGIHAFLVGEGRIPDAPVDWTSFFNTLPLQEVLASEQM
jgi:taurine transport system substrate-binding protein